MYHTNSTTVHYSAQFTTASYAPYCAVMTCHSVEAGPMTTLKARSAIYVYACAEVAPVQTLGSGLRGLQAAGSMAQPLLRALTDAQGACHLFVVLFSSSPKS